VRGNGRSDILTDDSERNRLLERLAERVESFNIRLYLFVRMTNHTSTWSSSRRGRTCVVSFRAKRLEFVEYDPMLAKMCRKRRDRAGKYRWFVESGLAETDGVFMEAMHESPRSIGSTQFHAWVDAQYRALVEQQRVPRDASFRGHRGHRGQPLKKEFTCAG
jgi:hypothetical protein